MGKLGLSTGYVQKYVGYLEIQTITFGITKGFLGIPTGHLWDTKGDNRDT